MLETCGYLRRIRRQDEHGHWITEWHISDDPDLLDEIHVVPGQTDDGFSGIGESGILRDDDKYAGRTEDGFLDVGGPGSDARKPPGVTDLEEHAGRTEDGFSGIKYLGAGSQPRIDLDPDRALDLDHEGQDPPPPAFDLVLESPHQDAPTAHQEEEDSHKPQKSDTAVSVDDLASALDQHLPISTRASMRTPRGPITSDCSTTARKELNRLATHGWTPVHITTWASLRPWTGAGVGLVTITLSQLPDHPPDTITTHHRADPVRASCPIHPTEPAVPICATCNRAARLDQETGRAQEAARRARQTMVEARARARATRAAQETRRLATAIQRPIHTHTET
jgi:hypothetical protein